MVNRVVLVGHLTRDPEMKYTPAGVAVAQMGIAVNRYSKNEQGEYETDFFNVVAWRRSAEFAANYLTKGRLVAIDGRLQTRSWTGQDGNKRTVVEIVADNVQGLDRPKSAETAYGGEHAVAASPPPGRPAPVAAGGAPSQGEDELDESDPFADE